MSLHQIRTEIVRFLATSTPEVLCIKGRWGVGKTYAWKRYLDEAQRNGGVVLKQYSYVSLFGLNSLADVRFSIFENTVATNSISAGPSLESFTKLLEKGGALGRKARPIVDALSSLVNRKGVADVLYKTAFLSVREQVVCIDDLERAGNGLDVRDVLGLLSQLKEERKCKVVLLLNDEQLADRVEFGKQLEKVSDVTLRFEITPSEAADIALPDASASLRKNVVALGITNIRVLKKIERVVGDLLELVPHASAALRTQATSTATLAAWATLQPDTAPSVTFIRRFNSLSIAMRKHTAEVDEEADRWADLFAEYGYGATDQFDRAVIDGVESGYFVPDRIASEAQQADQRATKSAGGTAFSDAWENLYHGSLATDDDEFLDALYASAVAEAAAIAPLNINSAIRLLKECGRRSQAMAVISAYITAHNNAPYDFFDISSHHFSQGDAVDPDLTAAFEKAQSTFVDDRDPFELIVALGEDSGWGEADVVLLAKLAVSDFVEMFERLRGRNLRRSIKVLQSMGDNGTKAGKKLGESVVAALLEIGRKSPLRARKVVRFGVVVPRPVKPRPKAKPRSRAGRPHPVAVAKPE